MTAVPEFLLQKAFHIPDAILMAKINISLDIKALKESMEWIQKRYSFDEKWQICLTHRVGITDAREKVFDGVGRLRGRGLGEFDFSIFNKEFEDTYLGYFFNQAQEYWEFGRMRLNQLPSHQCYSMHTDDSQRRLHIAIDTNSDSYIIFESGEMYHIPEDGQIYSMNPRVNHTAFNAGDRPRTHLLMEVRPRIAKEM